MIEAVRQLARAIELGGALLVGWALLRSLAAGLTELPTNAAIERMRLIMAEGVVGALGLLTAATLLKTITLRSWSAIGIFAVTLALRTLVKRALAAEIRSAPSPLPQAGPRAFPSSPVANGPIDSRGSPARD